jgi:hypothetical protein
MKLDIAELLGFQIFTHVAKDVRFLTGASKPRVAPSPIPKISTHKNPLDTWEIEGPAFAAKMLPPVRQRLYLFSERIPARIESVSERAEGSGFGERAAVF